jgi:hypothetical protein
MASPGTGRSGAAVRATMVCRRDGRSPAARPGSRGARASGDRREQHPGALRVEAGVAIGGALQAGERPTVMRDASSAASGPTTVSARGISASAMPTSGLALTLEPQQRAGASTRRHVRERRRRFPDMRPVETPHGIDMRTYRRDGFSGRFPCREREARPADRPAAARQTTHASVKPRVCRPRRQPRSPQNTSSKRAGRDRRSLPDAAASAPRPGRRSLLSWTKGRHAHRAGSRARLRRMRKSAHA